MRAITLAMAAVVVFASLEGRARAQACSGFEDATALQQGQDVRVEVSLESSDAGLVDILVVRDEGTAEEEELPFEAASDGCTVWMPPPADVCGCAGFSGSILDECVEPGEHTYTIYEYYPRATVDVDPALLATRTVTVDDSGDECLPSDGGADDCSVAGDGGVPPLPLTALAAAAGLAAMIRRRRS